MKPNEFKVGDTITDGNKAYVLDRDHTWSYISSGNHAKYHMTTDELKQVIE